MADDESIFLTEEQRKSFAYSSSFSRQFFYPVFHFLVCFIIEQSTVNTFYALNKQ